MARGRKPTKRIASFDEIANEEIETSGTVIRDKNLHPYYIKAEPHCFTVFKEGSPIHEGCFTQLPNAIKSIVQRKLNAQPGVVSLGEYVTRYENAVRQIMQMVNH